MNNNYIKVKIEGRNVNNYLKWLIKQKINIINLNIIKHNHLEVIINYKDYKYLKKYSKTYKVTIINKYGPLKLIEIFKKNSFILISIIIGIIFINFLSNIIFSIDIISNNQEIAELTQKELKKYGIVKYKFKKKYSYLEDVKKEILKNNKDTLEWIEIVENGTKYIIKLVERKQEIKVQEYEYQSISVTKDAIITSIKAYSGEKIKEVNDYIKKGEIVVSGIITKPDGTLIYTKGNAKVYGEVWYKVNVEYPYAYKEEKLTGKNKEVYIINFINNKISIFPYKKYKEFKTTSNVLLEHSMLPISFRKEKQYDVILKEEIYTWEEAISNAIKLSKKKLLEKNNKIVNINKVEILNKQTVGPKIKLTLFISVEEDITKVVEIKKIEENQQNNLQN